MKAALIALTLLSGLPARADLRRIAVVVGANQGGANRSTLRYSYSDAEQIASVLQQVGQFDAKDVHVLRDPAPQAVLDELDADLALLKRAAGESMLVFYYSGHADAQALYPGGQPLPFGQLRERLESQAATVRIGIIDACSGGGWTGTKGIHPSAPFVVDVPLQLTGEGSVLIASSSGAELAHESDQVSGSFFTHHLVAGLRGAADKNGDGVITLNDAFTYARERTIRDSAAVAEPQHPSFSMNLRGRSDLPLTRIAQSQTLVELSETEGPLQLIHLGTGLVVMEVPAGKRTIKLSVPAGKYLLRRQHAGGNYSREVTVEADHAVTVDEAELTLASIPHEAAKGPEEAPIAQELERPRLSWPGIVNDRPLALDAKAVELQFRLDGSRAGFAAATSSDTGRVVGRQLDTVSSEPIIRYGVTDRLTVSVGTGAGRSFCEGPVPCGDLAVFVEAGGLYLLYDDKFELAAIVNGSNHGGSGGLTGRIGRGLPVTFQLTAGVDRDFGLLNHSGWVVSALLSAQPLKRLSVDVGTVFWGNFTGELTLANPTIGATVSLNPHVDLRAVVTLNGGSASDSFTSGSVFEVSNGTSLGFTMVFRP